MRATSSFSACLAVGAIFVCLGCDRFRTPADDNRPPFLQVQTLLQSNIPIDRIGALDLTITAVPEGPGLPLSNTFSLEQSEEGKPQIFMRSQPEPGNPSRRELVISYGGNPFRNGARTVDLYLYPIFSNDAGITPRVTIKARVLTTTGQVMALGEALLDTTAEPLVFGGARDRTAQIIMNCVAGGACFTPLETRAARVNVTRAQRCPLEGTAARGALYAILVSTDEVTARRLWFRQDDVDFTSLDQAVSISFDVPVGGYTLFVVLDVGGDLLQTNLAPQRGDFVSSVTALQVNLDRETSKDIVLDQVVGVGPCQGAADFLPPTVTGTRPTSPSIVQAPTVVGLATPGTVVHIFTDAACSAPASALGGDSGSAFGEATSEGAFAVPVQLSTSDENRPLTFYARASNAAGRASACSPTFASYVLDTVAPSTPATVTAGIITASSISIVWSPVDDAGAPVRYEVCASTRSDGCAEFAVFVLTTDAAATINGLAANTRYSIFVRAVDDAGNRGTPTPPPGLVARTLTPASVSQVALGESHSCAIADEGQVFCWGKNDKGQAGQVPGPTTARIATPTRVVLGPPAAPLRALRVATGGGHTCAIAAAATRSAANEVYCWGANDFGQLGIGSSAAGAFRASPQLVNIGTQMLFGSPQRLALGKEHTCVTNDAGLAFCWGRNQISQLAFSTDFLPSVPDHSDLPVPALLVFPIPGMLDEGIPLTNVYDLAAGGDETCVLGPNGPSLGQRYCWGRNDENQVNPGGTFSTPQPNQTLGSSNSSGLMVGGAHACLLDSRSQLQCSGRAQEGQLGIGSTTVFGTSFVSPQFPGERTANVRVAAGGGQHTCVVDSQDGVLYCWGSNASGQIGDPLAMNPQLDPLPLSSPQLTVVQDVATGGGHTCALAGDGRLFCWGANESAQLGTGFAGNRFSPAEVAFPNTVPVGLSISAGERHTCARINDGTATCWGANESGQLGDATRTSRPEARTVIGLAPQSGVLSVAAGGAHTCAVVADGRVRCWGQGSYGQLGEGGNQSSTTPGVVSGLSGARQVSVGELFSCALLYDGTARCFGNSSYGQLASFSSGLTPQVVTVDGTFQLNDLTELAAGGRHACARNAQGNVSCWGSNSDGQLGNNEQAGYRNSAQAITGTNSQDYVHIASGDKHSCASTASGGVRCWGSNERGQIGDGLGACGARQDTAKDVPALTRVVGIAAGYDHSCALHGNGTVSCWGGNERGQLGNGAVAQSLTPRSVRLGDGGIFGGAVALTAGKLFTCALLSSGGVSCWGLNDYGQLGRRGGFPGAALGNLDCNPPPDGGVDGGIIDGGGPYRTAPETVTPFP